MEFEFSEGKISFSKELSDIDRFVLRFVEILNSLHIKYIIVSGYVPILFGRSRSTEDIDMFIEDIGKNKFDELSEKEEKAGLWILNTSDRAMAFQMLKEDEAIRIAKEKQAIPNIEMKINRDERVWKDTIEVVVNKSSIITSRIESQIAFKLYLGSEKDIEDAVYLYELFKDKLDMKTLAERCKALNVLEAMNTYVR
ncbi:MAG: hypothetical protein HYY37_04410 [Candidatus Aenigmarchaeota archaeon]|nr:hypothetical protein [Candidatus Aenigmarchaeota archaeon]